MTFMDEVVKQNIPIWEKCAVTPFIKDLQTGTLPEEKFKQYMIQDSIYLKNYARAYGMAIYRSANLKDIQMYYSILSFVTDGESLVRLSYLRQFGLTDEEIEYIKPLPENQKYIDFLQQTAERGNDCDILMAVLPCMLSYSYIFRKIAAAQNIAESRYSDFIQDYAEEQYFENCKIWCAFADSKCNALPQCERERLSSIFKTGSLLELAFWEMAYRD